MAILDQLFGLQPQQGQGAGGLVQSILSQRFQPSPEDINQATAMSGISRNYVSPSAAMQQRIAPAMGVAGTLGQLNMSQIALQKMEEEQMRDRMMWMMELGKLPGGGGMMGNIMQPPVGFTQGADQAMSQGNTAPPVGFPQSNQGTMPPDQQRTALAELYPTSAPGGMNSPVGGEVPLTAPQGQRQPVLSGFGQPIAVPEGPVMARDASGNVSAMQIPGAPPKMENGMAISTDPKTGQPLSQVPYNAEARQKFETQLQEMKSLYDQLHAKGGSVEEGGNVASNLMNSMAGSNFTLPEWAGSGTVGGQNISRISGSSSQVIRDRINNLSKQMIMPYMQAVGATPGMERAYQAQLMLLQALGANPTQERQTVEGTLADLSKQAGTGSLSKAINVNGSAPHPLDGTTATNAQGQTLILKNGQWTPQ